MSSNVENLLEFFGDRRIFQDLRHDCSFATDEHNFSFANYVYF